jgi:hypothetical protein
VASISEAIAADKKVSLDGNCPGSDGGQGSKALSVPMREDSPAANINPAKLGERAMLRSWQNGSSAERKIAESVTKE